MAAHLKKLVFFMSPAGLLPSFLHSVMLSVCILAIRLHIAGDDDLVCMMLASSCWSLATRRTRRRHGANVSVTGMIQIPNSSISIAARLPWGFWCFSGFSSLDSSGLCFPMVTCIYKLLWKTCLVRILPKLLLIIFYFLFFFIVGSSTMTHCAFAWFR